MRELNINRLNQQRKKYMNALAVMLVALLMPQSLAAESIKATLTANYNGNWYYQNNRPAMTDNGWEFTVPSDDGSATYLAYSSGTGYLRQVTMEAETESTAITVKIGKYMFTSGVFTEIGEFSYSNGKYEYTFSEPQESWGDMVIQLNSSTPDQKIIIKSITLLTGQYAKFKDGELDTPGATKVVTWDERQNASYSVFATYNPAGLTYTYAVSGFEGSNFQPQATYQSSNTDVATVNNEGQVTIIGAGEATITANIIADDNFLASTDSYLLTVNPAQFNVYISDIDDQTFTGSAITPALAVTLTGAGIQLTAGTDYDVVYSNNVNAANSTDNLPPTASLIGKGNYTSMSPEGGEAIAIVKTFTIKPAAFSDVTITGIENKAYTGSAITQTPVVKLGSYTLTADKEYEVSGNTQTNAGDYTATITNKSANFSGTSKTVNYSITAKPLTTDMIQAIADQDFANQNLSPDIVVKDGTYTLVQNKDYTIEFDTQTNVNVGTASFTITGMGNYSGTATGTFKIVARALTESMITFSAGDYVYDGQDKEPTITVYDAEFKKSLTENTDYTVSYSDRKNAGTCTVTITGKGNYKNSIEKTFTIAKAASSVTTAPTAKAGLVYTGAAQELITAGTASGGTIQYSLDGGAYGTAIPTGTAAKSYTVKYKVVGDANHNDTQEATVENVKIAKATATLTFSATTASGTAGEAFTAPTLTTTPAGLTVSYQSSAPTVATVNQTTGEVTLLAEGETTIRADFAGNTNYEAAYASYTLTVAPGITKYNIWVGDTQVTEENLEDILGDATAEKAATFQYFPETNNLIVTNNTEAKSIRSSQSEGLIIYLAPSSNNKLGQISSTVEAPLTITTDGTFPGRVELSVTSGTVISGFSTLTLEQNLAILSPENISYTNKALNATGATIGVVIEPVVEEKKESFEGNSWYKNPDGTENDLTNFIYDDRMLLTLKKTNAADGDGWDDPDDLGNTGLVLNEEMSKDWRDNLNLQTAAPGTEAFAAQFTGITFLVPAGKGWIVVDGETHDNYVMKMSSLSSNDWLEEMTSESRTSWSFHYDFDKPTFVGIYNGGKEGSSARSKVIRPGKKTVVHIKVYGVIASPETIQASNPVSAASANSYQGKVPSVGQDTEVPSQIESGIETIRQTPHTASDRWYNLNGQQIDRPTKEGLYIHNGQKIYIK